MSLPTTPSRIEFQEWAGSPTLSLTNGQLAGTRVFRVDWGDWPGFVDDLFGSPQSIGGATSLGSDPATFPLFDGDGNEVNKSPLAAVDYTVRPHMPNDPLGSGDNNTVNPDWPSVSDLSTGTNNFPGALITVQYHPYLSLAEDYAGPQMPSQLQHGALLTYSTEFGCEYIQIPGRYLVWASDLAQLPGDVQTGVRLPTNDFVFRFDRVIDPAFSAMQDDLGQVNNAAFMGNPTGTVLFDSYVPRPMFLPSGHVLWNITMRFKVRAIPSGYDTAGWNYSYRYDQGANAWAEVQDKGTGDPPFNEVDFTELFQ